MIIYHGSTVLVDKPEILAGETFLDFGVGFYTTTGRNGETAENRSFAGPVDVPYG